MDRNNNRRLKSASAEPLTHEPAGFATRSAVRFLSPSPHLSFSLSRPVFPTLRRSLRAVIATAVACGLIYLAGDRRHPLPPAVGGSLFGESVGPVSKSAKVRLATFNIHSGTGRDRRLDLARTAATLKGIDFAFLNEVHGPYFWQATGQAEQLAELTGRRWLFAPTEERWWHHQFGNAVLSADNATRWQRLPLPSAGHSYRNAVLIAIEHAGRTIHIVGTHFDRNSADDRAEQFRAVAGLFLDLAEPAILMGDLNATADDSAIKNLLAHEDVHDPLHEVLGDDIERHIDWILTRGLKTLDAGMLDNGASDHPLVWAELE